MQEILPGNLGKPPLENLPHLIEQSPLGIRAVHVSGQETVKSSKERRNSGLVGEKTGFNLSFSLLPQEDLE